MTKTTLLAALPLCVAMSAAADTPAVVADIPPVHALVAQVMGDVGQPGLIMPAGASPHDHAMRPSEAALLQEADILFWIGGDLTPWLERSVEAINPDAVSIEFLGRAETFVLPFREGATFESHDHAEHAEESHDHAEHAEESHDHAEHAEEGHDDHAREDHAAHDHHDEHDEHDEHAEHDDDHTEHGDDHAGHDEEHAGKDHAEHDHTAEEHAADAHAGHDHGEHDPHVWLDPQNGIAWLDVIADELSALDPENAATYRANAEAGKAEIALAMSDVAERLSVGADREFVVFHDAFQYFEARFDTRAAGAIVIGDGVAPGAARVAEIKDTVRHLNVSCAFSEPQMNSALINTVFEGLDVKLGVIDPLGVDLGSGPELYPALIRSIGASLADCLE